MRDEVRSGYPLAMLFVIIALFSALAAMVQPVVKDSGTRGITLGAFEVLVTTASGGFGCILGALIGGYLGGRMRDGFLGALGGTVMCMLVWPIVLLDGDRWGLLTVLSIGGSLCMVGIGMVYRLLARRRKE